MQLPPQRKRALLRRLAALYPDPRSELVFRNEFQLVCAVLLSAQCTDKKVNETTPVLFSNYPDFKALSSAKLSSVEKIIRPINYYRSKSRHLIGMADRVIKQYGGKLPRAHTELTTLPGVGQKTANVILNELGIEPAFPVDTHVFRVSQRLGLASGESVKLTEQELRAAFLPAQWRELHHWLILHGRRVCKAQRPLCGQCELSALCPSASVDLLSRSARAPSSKERV